MDRISRRKFVTSLTVIGTAAAVLPFVADADDQPAQPIYWAKAGDVKTFPVNTPTFAAYPPEYGPGGVYVTRVDDKTATALSARCTHHGCKVAYDGPSKTYSCPCHGAQFSAAGDVIKGPARRPLPTLQAKIDGGFVYVQSLTAPHPAS